MKSHTIIKSCTSLNCPERKSTCCGSQSKASKSGEHFECASCGKEYVGGECTAGVNQPNQLKELAEEMINDGDDYVMNYGKKLQAILNFALKNEWEKRK